MPEVPAAHSMDTTWFAVDQDGNVATFETLQDGAIPKRAAGGGDHLLDEPDEISLLGAVAAWMHAQGRYDEEGLLLEDARVVLLVHALGPWAPLIERGQLEVVRDRPPLALMPPEPLTEALIAEIEARPLGGTLCVDSLLEFRDADETPAEFGVFVYFNSDMGIPGEYVRHLCPDRTLTLSELPPALQARLGGLRMALRFSDVGELQLADLEVGPVLCWSKVDLRGRPVGGR